MFGSLTNNLNTLSSLCTKVCADGRLAVANLPAILRQNILEYIVRERRVCPPSFLCSLLEKGGIKSLDLWTLSDDNAYTCGDIEVIVKTLHRSLTSLVYLSIGGASWVHNGDSFSATVKSLYRPNFQNMRYLQIQQVSNGEELIQILASCPNLVTLEISQPSITDNHLITVSNMLSRVAARKSLRRLSLPSSILEDGLVIILNCFLGLQFLTTSRLQFSLDDETTRQNLNQLEGLSVRHPLGMDSVERLVTQYPSLIELSLEVQECMKLQFISRLTRLKRLEFRNSPNYPVSFSNQVLPLLEDIGSNLESLSLEKFNDVDLSKCASFCPNLRDFSVQWFSHLSFCYPSRTFRKNKCPPFRDLCCLKLRPKPQRILECEVIHFLLDFAVSIVKVELYCCHNFDDNVMTRILESNKLSHLKIFILRHGHSLSKGLLTRLIFASSSLEYIDCGQGYPPKANPLDSEDNFDNHPGDINNNFAHPHPVIHDIPNLVNDENNNLM